MTMLIDPERAKAEEERSTRAEPAPEGTYQYPSIWSIRSSGAETKAERGRQAWGPRSDSVEEAGGRAGSFG